MIETVLMIAIFMGDGPGTVGRAGLSTPRDAPRLNARHLGALPPAPSAPVGGAYGAAFSGLPHARYRVSSSRRELASASGGAPAPAAKRRSASRRSFSAS